MTIMVVLEARNVSAYPVTFYSNAQTKTTSKQAASTGTNSQDQETAAA
jgi:hypothetical protein